MGLLKLGHVKAFKSFCGKMQMLVGQITYNDPYKFRIKYRQHCWGIGFLVVSMCKQPQVQKKGYCLPHSQLKRLVLLSLTSIN